MNEIVTLERLDDVALLRIDNPPVNALGHPVRSGLMDRLSEAADDPAIAAIVIAGAGRGFSAGADISEFGKPSRAPSLVEVIAAVEAAPKPVLAAIHGMALGGGFELALGCHFRAVAPDANLGLPEIKLGLLPGAGGTQRLPRLIGPVAALDMIVSGEPITGEEAGARGIADHVVTGDFEPGVLDFVRQMLARNLHARPVRDRAEALEAARADRSEFDRNAETVLARARGAEAPAACVESISNSLDMPFDAALKRERVLFEELREGPQSKAQRHIFFAERAAAKVPDLGKAQPRTVGRAIVVGSGTMGTGIAISLADAGIAVDLADADGARRADSLRSIASHYGRQAKRGWIEMAEAEARTARVTAAVDLSAARNADLAIEAVFEDMEAKKAVFVELDRHLPDHALLATNTSYLDIDELARATTRPERVLGLHFFSPAHVMRLLEVVRAKATAPDVLATALRLGRNLGKVPVVVGNAHGFVGNRMLKLRARHAERLLLEGARVEEVDGAMLDFGFPMGPFAAADLAGLDISWRMRRATGERAPLADALCEAGRFGQKSGAGYYRYDAGDRSPMPDPDVDGIIAEVARREGIKQRSIDSAEIVERLVLPLVNEGARLLEEGIAARASDIDVIWVHGYGWPAWRGGPMYHADQLGLAEIRNRLSAFAAEYADESLVPAPLLVRLAAEGGTFTQG